MITLAELKATLEPNLRRRPDEQVWAVAVDELPQDLDTSLKLGERTFRVARAGSPLAVRDALASRGLNNDLLIVTSVSERELGDDVLVRLGRHRLLSPARWEAVAARFRAARIDSQLIASKNLAQPLLQSEPTDGFLPAPHGLLTAKHAWGYLFGAYFKWDSVPSDSSEFFERLLDHAPQVSSYLEQEAIRFLEKELGESIVDVWRYVQDAGRFQALAAGLILEGLENLIDLPESERILVQGRLEGALGFRPSTRQKKAWASAATRLWSDLSPEDREIVSSTARELADSLSEKDILTGSSCIPLAFEKQLERLASALVANEIQDAEACFRRVERHHQADLQATRLASAETAVRVARFLREPPALPSSLHQLAKLYSEQVFLLEEAEHCLQRGDANNPVNEAFHKLRAQLVKWLGQFQGNLTNALVQQQELGKGLLPLEQVNDALLAPLLAGARVLYVVLDGARQSDIGHLVSSANALGWEQHSLERLGYPITPFPSLTALSRTSLLTGQLEVGNQDTEKKGFVSHDALHKACQKGYPPSLYHKSSVRFQIEDELSSRLLEDKRKLIGVVVNVFDDLLDKGEQLAPITAIDQIPPLAQLLQLAARARRVVVLASDHGHILDRGEKGHSLPPGVSSGSRWRSSGGKLRDFETELEGDRVLHPVTGNREKLVFLSATEDHYGRRAAGYHGGLHAAEILPPLALLAQHHHKEFLDSLGFERQQTLLPTWYYPTSSERESVDVKGQTLLFAGDPRSQAEHLLKSAWFKSQVPAEEERQQMSLLLRACEGTSSKPIAILARETSVPVQDAEALTNRLVSILTFRGRPYLTIHQSRVKVDWDGLRKALRKEA